jgi:hypothetical protein
MNKLYKSAILNLLKASNDFDHVGLGSFSARSLKLAQTLTKKSEQNSAALITAALSYNSNIEELKTSGKALIDLYDSYFGLDHGGAIAYQGEMDNLIRSLRTLSFDKNIEDILGNNPGTRLKVLVDKIEHQMDTSGTWGYQQAKVRAAIGVVFNTTGSIISSFNLLKSLAGPSSPAVPSPAAIIIPQFANPGIPAGTTPAAAPNNDQAISGQRRKYPPIDEVVQQWLGHELNRKIGVDGSWGPETNTALKDWIKAHPTATIKDPAELVEFWTRIKDQLIKKMNAPSASEEAAATEAPDAAAKQNKAEPTLAYGKKQQLTRILNQLISQRGRVFNFQGLKQEQRDEMSGALSSMLENLQSNNIKGMRANWFNFKDLTKNFNLGLPQFNDIQNIINTIED